MNNQQTPANVVSDRPSSGAGLALAGVGLAAVPLAMFIVVLWATGGAPLRPPVAGIPATTERAATSGVPPGG